MCFNLSHIFPKNNNCKYLSQHYTTHNLLSVAPSTNHTTPSPIVFKCDSGASKHFIKALDEHILLNSHQISNGPPATLPNKENIFPSSMGNLPIPTLPKSATSLYVYPGLLNSSLLSIGQLCDENCIDIFTKLFLHI